MRRLRALALVALLLAPGAASAGDARVGDLLISGAEVSAAMAASPTAAAYLTIENAGSEPDRLVAVETTAAQMAELHETLLVDGVARMAPVEGGIEVPAGGSATLARRGMHVMLMGLTAPLAEGAAVDLTLVFERAGRVGITAPVHLGPAAQHQHSGG